MSRVLVAAGAIRYDLAAGVQRDALRRTRTWRLRAVTSVAVLVAAVTVYRAWPAASLPEDLAELRTAKDNPDAWARAGDGLMARGDGAAAAGAYGVARLLAPDRTTWRDRPLVNAPDVVRQVPIVDAAWIGKRAGDAERLGEFNVAERLFLHAQELNLSNAEWRRGVERARAFGQVRAELTNDAHWVSLSHAFQTWGDMEASAGASAVAHLLQPTRWPIARTRLITAPVVVRRLVVRDTTWIDRLAEAAKAIQAFDTAAALYEVAAAVDPGEARWLALATESRLRNALSGSLRDDEIWGALGKVYERLGSQRSRGAYRVAALLDPQDGEWQPRAANVPTAEAVALLRALGVRDDGWVGSLAEAALARGEAETARELYELARSLDPGDPRWTNALARTRNKELPPGTSSDATSPPTNGSGHASGGPSAQPATASPVAPPIVAAGRGANASSPPPVPEPPPPPSAALTRLSLRAAYPIVVHAAGRTYAAALSRELMLPPGTQVDVQSAQIYMRRTVTVESTPAGTQLVELPRPLRVQIQALPADCTVRINGLAATQPYTVAEGTNEFEFTWSYQRRTLTITREITRDGQQIVGSVAMSVLRR